MDKTNEAVNWQISAMGVQVFEVGLFKPDANSHGQPVMIPRTWDTETVTRSIPWLRLQNAGGRNIYIRPRGEHNLSLVDDLSQALCEAGIPVTYFSMGGWFYGITTGLTTAALCCAHNRSSIA